MIACSDCVLNGSYGCLHDLLNQIHPKITSASNFTLFVESLRAKISNHLRDVESSRQPEYSAHLATEADRRNQDLEVKFQDDLPRMSVEGAQKRKELEEGTQIIINGTRKEDARRRREDKSAKVAFDGEIA
jgi:hypothetical protein